MTRRYAALCFAPSQFPGTLKYRQPKKRYGAKTILDNGAGSWRVQQGTDELNAGLAKDVVGLFAKKQRAKVLRFGCAAITVFILRVR
ncbi:MAG: hypothetical protein WBC68_00855, partial [Albidovulum sp.]